MSSSSSPPPFSWTPSQSFDGNGGSWSSFILSVGIPAQSFRVLPSTNGQQIWVLSQEGCLATDPPNCGDSRGVMPFQGSGNGSGNSDGVPNNDAPESDNLPHIAIQNGAHNGFQTKLSSSWMAEGVFDLDIENPLNFNLSDSSNFGHDNVSLSIQGSNQLTLSKQLVASFATRIFI